MKTTFINPTDFRIEDGEVHATIDTNFQAVGATFDIHEQGLYTH